MYGLPSWYVCVECILSALTLHDQERTTLIQNKAVLRRVSHGKCTLTENLTASLCNVLVPFAARRDTMRHQTDLLHVDFVLTARLITPRVQQYAPVGQSRLLCIPSLGTCLMEFGQSPWDIW